MEANQTAPREFNNADWNLFPGNKNHVRFLPKCMELFWLIFEYQQLTGEAFFGQEWLSEKMGITVRHVQNLIAELRSKNLIEVDRRDQNYYRITEFFSHEFAYWTELAKAKAKAATEKFFPKTASQKASTQNHTSKPRKESSFKAAKAQPTTQPEPTPEPTPEERQETERRAQENMAKLMAEQQAKYEAEKQIVTPELKHDVEQVTEEVGKQYYKKPKPYPAVLSQEIRAKLKEYGIEVPGWFLGEVVMEWLDKRRYQFR